MQVYGTPEPRGAENRRHIVELWNVCNEIRQLPILSEMVEEISSASGSGGLGGNVATTTGNNGSIYGGGASGGGGGNINRAGFSGGNGALGRVVVTVFST